MGHGDEGEVFGKLPLPLPPGSSWSGGWKNQVETEDSS